MLFDSRYFRYALGTIGAFGASVLVYRYFVRPIQNAKRWSHEINEVLITNDLTELCNCNNRDNISKSGSCSQKYCYRGNLNRIVELIDGAKYSIYLSIYIFTIEEIANALIRAQRRGAIVRVIADESMAFASNSQIIKLSEAGIPIRVQNNVHALMHHKFCLIDAPSGVAEIRSPVLQDQNSNKPNPKSQTYFDGPRSILLNGSMNWTMQGFTANWDNIIVTSNRELVNAFEGEFGRMWESFQIQYFSKLID